MWTNQKNCSKEGRTASFFAFVASGEMFERNNPTRRIQCDEQKNCQFVIKHDSIPYITYDLPHADLNLFYSSNMWMHNKEDTDD